MRYKGLVSSALLLGLALLVPLFMLGGVRFYKKVQFENGCGGRLKRAADANTIEIARSELGAAIKYLEDNNLTRGYTSILYQTPDEDVGFWYSNLKASAEELDKVAPQASQVEKTNVLMKLRETLLDTSDKGQTKVTAPAGIAVYPNNAAYAFAATLFGIMAAVGLIVIVFGLDRNSY
jgi:hypothetical protein